MINSTLSQFVSYRIRMAMDPEDHEGLSCVFQKKKPVIWRGTDVDVEIGLFNTGEFVSSITNIVKVMLELHSSENRGSSPYVQKTVLNAAMNGSLTEVLWEGGDPEDSHAVFHLTHDDTNFDFTSAIDNKIQLWMVIHAELTGGELITLGTTVLTIEEDAANLGLPVIGTSAPNYRLSGANKLQLRNPTTGKWYTLYFDGPEGAETLTWEAGET